MPTLLAALTTAAVLTWGEAVTGETVPVLHPEGPLCEAMVLSTLDGSHLAEGDLTQTVSGDIVTSRLAFRFDDGSQYEERTVYSQQRRFRLVSHHLSQMGPSFPNPLEMAIDAASGQVSVRYTDEDGNRREDSRRIDLPTDLANGIIAVLLKNIAPGATPESFSFLAATPRPRLVRLEVRARHEPDAIHYVLKVDLGLFTGLVASLAGRRPPDSHVWITSGDAPAFVRAEEPLYVGGPLWRIEPAASAARR